MTQRDRDSGGQTTDLDKTESLWKVCMCGVSAPQWSSTQITLFERTLLGAWPTLWRHHWQEVSEFLCTKAPLVGGSQATQPNPRKCSLWRATNVMFSKNRGSRYLKKTTLRALQCVAACCSVLQCVCCPIFGRRTKNIKQQSNPPNAHPNTHRLPPVSPCCIPPTPCSWQRWKYTNLQQIVSAHVTKWQNCQIKPVPGKFDNFQEKFKKPFSKPDSITSNLECDVLWRKHDVTHFGSILSLSPTQNQVWVLGIFRLGTSLGLLRQARV